MSPEKRHEEQPYCDGTHHQRWVDGFLFASRCNCSGKGPAVDAALALDRRFGNREDGARFDFDHFQPHNQSLTEALQKIRWIASTWSLGAVLWGDTGSGKTHLARALCYEAAAQRKRADIVSSPSLQKWFRDSQGYEDIALDARAILDKLKATSLLVIDDLGTERKGAEAPSDIWLREFKEFLDSFRGVLIVTMNLNPKGNLSDIVGEKSKSRISELCGAVHLDAPDYRGHRAKQNAAALADQARKPNIAQEGKAHVP